MIELAKKWSFIYGIMKMSFYNGELKELSGFLKKLDSFEIGS